MTDLSELDSYGSAHCCVVLDQSHVYIGKDYC